MKIEDLFQEEMTTVANIDPGPFTRKKKKKKKKEDDKLYEGLSPVLFHATSLKSFVQIMNTNEIRLSKDPLNPGNFYMSFSRNRTNDFLRYLNDMRDRDLDEEAFNPRSDAFVVIRLDGVKLSSNYSGKPFDTFAYDEEDYGRPEHSDFMEDRLYSRRPTVTNARRFIQGVSLITNGKNVPDRTLIKLSEIFGVRFSMYEDLNSYFRGSVIER